MTVAAAGRVAVTRAPAGSPSAEITTTGAAVMVYPMGAPASTSPATGMPLVRPSATSRSGGGSGSTTLIAVPALAIGPVEVSRLTLQVFIPGVMNATPVASQWLSITSAVQYVHVLAGSLIAKVHVTEVPGGTPLTVASIGTG